MKIAYDIKRMRPGCVILQAVLGGETEAAKLFPANLWLTDLTDDMRVYEITDDQLRKLVTMTEEAGER